MLRIITLNLNGIRSACTKGLLDWLPRAAGRLPVRYRNSGAGRRPAPEMRARRHAGLVPRRREEGYSGVGIYSRHAPDRVVEGLSIPRSTPRAASCSSTSASSRWFRSICPPARLGGAPTDQVRFHGPLPAAHGPALPERTGGRGVRRLEHRPPRSRSEELVNRRTPASCPRNARVVQAFVRRTGLDRRLSPPAQPRATGACAWWSDRGQRGRRTWDGGWTTRSPPRDWLRAPRRRRSWAQRFSDHAPLTVDYDWTL